MESLEGFFSYDELLIEPLAQLGWQVDFVPWRRHVDWSRYELVVIRTPWDYCRHPAAFLDVLRTIERQTDLENPLEIVLWNLDKRYLLDLEERGILIVPTLVLGESPDEAILDQCADLGAARVVLKPVVSANAENTHLVTLDRPDRWSQLGELAPSLWLAQPFIESVLHDGETSLFYFGGEYSHAITKRPAPGDFRVQEEHGGLLESIVPDATLRNAGDAVIRAIGRDLLYARVDLVRHEDRWMLMELELIEPSLYFNMDAESPARFAKIFDRWVDCRSADRDGSTRIST